MPQPSRLGRGPLHPAPAVRASTDAEDASGGDDGPMPLRVVVVDDDARFRLMARRVLSADGVDVVAEAGTGEEAMVVLAESRPDVVLLDVRLPGIDGLEVARRLRPHDGSTAVILVSTCDVADGQRMARGLAAGFLPKDSLSLAAILGIIEPAP